MTNLKITELNPDTDPSLDDVTLIVNDPTGIATTRKTTVSNLLKLVFPVGVIYTSVVSTSPATLFGFGTWSSFGAGRVLVSLDSGQTEFDTVEETGGAKTHTLTEAEMPVHTHIQDSHNHIQDAHSHLTQRYPTATGSSSGFTIDTSMSGTLADNTLPTKVATATNQVATAVNQNTGSGNAHNNLQPYIVVYMWKRTA